MRTKRTKVYFFKELNKTTQDKVVNDTINDMVQYESADHYDNWPEFKKAIDKAEKMQTPWFAGSYVYEYCGNAIITMLNENTDWEFTIDGRMI